jgi:hypothetical protein
MRRWFLISIPLVALLAIGLWLSAGGTHRIARQNFERIEEGMTSAEVQALFSKKAVYALEFGETVDAFYSEKDPTGLMPRDTIQVKFSNDGKVVGSRRL